MTNNLVKPVHEDMSHRESKTNCSQNQENQLIYAFAYSFVYPLEGEKSDNLEFKVKGT